MHAKFEKEEHIKRGDIYYADLGDVFGSEQAGIRPVLIVQNDVGNRYSPTVIVAPLTSKERKHQLPTHCIIKNHGRLKVSSLVLLEQLRVIDKTRLKGKRVGFLDDDDMKEVDKALSISVGLKKEGWTSEDGIKGLIP